MKIKNILITGDDGYNSIGIRLLIHFLKNKYQLKVAATKKQQSAVGGKMTLDKKMRWGKKLIDEVETIWVDGTPCDALEFASNHFKSQFDLVISGVNLGPNVSDGAWSSGTFAAGDRARSLKLGKKVLVLSWDTPSTSFHHINYHGNENLYTFLDYPGAAINKVIELSIQNNLWNCDLLNINFPMKKSHKIIFTKLFDNPGKIYSTCDKIKTSENEPKYCMRQRRIKVPLADLKTDVGAIQNGYISITPCDSTILHRDIYQKLKNKKLSI